MKTTSESIAGWGRSAFVSVDALTAESRSDLAHAALPPRVIARGLGRSYGDAAQRNGAAVLMTPACNMAEWVDQPSGLLRVDAGASIGDLIDRYATRGWFVPVSPGTRQVTVGGAIAADVHGKNHHVDGSFGNHVRSMRLRLADDTIVQVSPADDSELFWATVGGMGLTGIVIDADIAMTAIPTTQVRVETQRLDTLDELMHEMLISDTEHDFSVAWVDLISNGRSVLTQGSFAEVHELGHVVAGAHQRPPSPAIGLPPVPSPRLVHMPLMKVFNELWWRRAPAELTVTHESVTAFWHPLDAIRDWNRLYGPSGFYQWQCVIPDEHERVFREICAQLAKLPSCLTVLKRFGAGNAAPLSFPRSGWTLAVDLPATAAVRSGLDRLDELVVAAEGRLYLAKDARQSRSTFEAGYPRLAEWKAVRHAVDPNQRWQSDLSVRLGL